MKAFLESFRTVPCYEGLYEVSDYGAVMSLNYRGSGKKKEMKGVKNRGGYERVILSRDGVVKCFRVHRLVWEAFNGPIPEGMEIDHINTIRDDNRLVNLRCVTPKENCNNPITYERQREATKRRSENMEWREAVREGCKRRSECPKWQEAQREAAKRRSDDPKWREAIRRACARPVLQLDKVTGKILREWECIQDVERELGVRHVSECCNGKRKTAGGFRWEFKQTIYYNF